MMLLCVAETASLKFVRDQLTSDHLQVDRIFRGPEFDADAAIVS